jgi:hypothetical protein
MDGARIRDGSEILPADGRRPRTPESKAIATSGARQWGRRCRSKPYAHVPASALAIVTSITGTPAPTSAASGTRTGAADGPADAEQRSAHHVTDASSENFRRKAEGLTVGVLQAETFDESERRSSRQDRGTHDAVHVKRVEPEHLLHPEPGDHFCFREDEAECGAQHEVRPEPQDLHRKTRGSSTKVANRPPAKKPHTAIKDGSCRSESPAIAWPDVHPPA